MLSLSVVESGSIISSVHIDDDEKAYLFEESSVQSVD